MFPVNYNKTDSTCVGTGSDSQRVFGKQLGIDLIVQK